MPTSIWINAKYLRCLYQVPQKTFQSTAMLELPFFQVQSDLTQSPSLFNHKACEKQVKLLPTLPWCQPASCLWLGLTYRFQPQFPTEPDRARRPFKEKTEDLMHSNFNFTQKHKTVLKDCQTQIIKVPPPHFSKVAFWPCSFVLPYNARVSAISTTRNVGCLHLSQLSPELPVSKWDWKLLLLVNEVPTSY